MHALRIYHKQARKNPLKTSAIFWLGTGLGWCCVELHDGTGSVLCRIALWDWVGVVSNCTMGLGRCCVELHYETGSVLYRNALWDWVGVVSKCTMGLGCCFIELHYGTESVLFRNALWDCFDK